MLFKSSAALYRVEYVIEGREQNTFVRRVDAGDGLRRPRTSPLPSADRSVSLSGVSDFLIVRVRARSVDVGWCDDEREHICHHADWY